MKRKRSHSRLELERLKLRNNRLVLFLFTGSTFGWSWGSQRLGAWFFTHELRYADEGRKHRSRGCCGSHTGTRAHARAFRGREPLPLVERGMKSSYGVASLCRSIPRVLMPASRQFCPPSGDSFFSPIQRRTGCFFLSPLSNIREITERDRTFGKMLLNASLSLFLLARITFFRARNNRFPCTILPVSIEGHERWRNFAWTRGKASSEALTKVSQSRSRRQWAGGRDREREMTKMERERGRGTI